ncbi:MAG: MoxR family ATPase [Prevotellaceae bacterium]|jgi:MoxR-like ATPase|nr:MoxR family ATPase [Prevotellaceae bacterium]
MEIETETEQFSYQGRIDLSGLRDSVSRIRHEIKKVIVGQDIAIDLILTAVLSDAHMLIEGVPGVAKTIMAKLTAQCIDAPFSRIQFTPDMMPSDVIGTSVFNEKITDFEFKKGPVFASIVMIDEINRAPAKTQAALFEVMAERQITVDGQTHKFAKPFTVIATQNPVEQEGTYRLPEAQLDRFLFKIEIPYPTLQEEIGIVRNHNLMDSEDETSKVEKVITSAEIVEYQALVRQVHVEDSLIEYIAKIVVSTRTNANLYLGASPRASIAILNASKAYAAMQGKDFVTPEDIKFIAPFVLKHRLLLTPEREMEGLTATAVVRQIVDGVEVPR